MKLLFLGDFFYDYDYLTSDLESIISFIQKNDYKVILNLETALCSANEPIKKRGPNLKSNIIIIDIIKKMNCICVCMANNHAMDFGGRSLIETKRILENEGIKCIGAGKNLDEALEAFEFETGGKKIIVQNYGWDVEETVYAGENLPGCAPLEKENIIRQIKINRQNKQDGTVINIFHWGFEYNTLPMPRDIDLAHKCVDSGCDLIIGHHPHVIQPYEIYCGKNIYYSLGNFYFASRRDKFPKSFEKEFCMNYADYGAGIVYDTNNGNTENIIFYYDRINKSTSVITHEKHEYLQQLDTKGWDSIDYIKKAKEHAYKPNPILGLDEEENRKTILKLQAKYFIAQKVQFLKKNRWGEKVYNFLKSNA